MRNSLRIAIVGLVLLLSGCPRHQDLVNEKTGKRLEKQYEFEDTYTDTDGDM